MLLYNGKPMFPGYAGPIFKSTNKNAVGGSIRIWNWQDSDWNYWPPSQSAYSVPYRLIWRRLASHTFGNTACRIM
jgi:hypothetical protein